MLNKQHEIPKPVESIPQWPIANTVWYDSSSVLSTRARYKIPQMWNSGNNMPVLTMCSTRYSTVYESIQQVMRLELQQSFWRERDAKDPVFCRERCITECASLPQSFLTPRSAKRIFCSDRSSSCSYRIEDKNDSSAVYPRESFTASLCCSCVVSFGA